MKVAALDLGTNTFILLIAEVREGRIEKVLHDEVRIVRLGQGVHQSRRFHPEALERAEACFKDFSQVIRKYDVSRTLACATSAARDVQNGQDLIDIAARHGIPVEIISGEQEAEYTFTGTLRGELEAPAMIVDTGGGSTEYILGEGSKIVARKSLDIGSVRLTEMFVTQHPIAPSEIKKMTSYIDEQLKLAKSALPSRASGAKLIAVAGTPTTLAAIDQGLPFETERVDGYRIPVERIEAWAKRLAAMKVEERQHLAGMEPKRADVIVAGALILMQSARAFAAKEIEVSTRGLRYGVAKRLASE